MSNQPINLILCVFCVSVLKMAFKKGHKSSAFRLFWVLLAISALIGLAAYFMNVSTEQTNKVSFKAAGLKYREMFTDTKAMSLLDVPFEEKQQKNRSTQDYKSQNSTNKNNTESENEQHKISSLTTTVLNQPGAVEMTKITSDLQVLSSFDCVKDLHQPSFVTFRT